MTELGQAWMDENLEAESWQYLGSGLGVDHRMAGDIIEGMIGDGLEIGE